MSGIVGAVGVDAGEAVPQMCEILAHRGSIRQSSLGALADGSPYAVSVLGRATLSEISNSHGSVISADDSLYSSYARAQIVDRKSITLERDLVGSRPLFYGANDENSRCAFASERKALWSVGCKRPMRVDPNTFVTIFGPTIEDTNVKKTSKSFHNKLLLRSESELVSSLLNVLKRVVDDLTHKQMSVAFSGGVDSALLCQLMPDKAKHRYFAIGLSKSNDLKNAQHSANLLNIELQTVELNENDFETLIPAVIRATESINPLDIAIALPLYILAAQTEAAGFSLMLTGQGADELFAGYSKYASLHATRHDWLNNALETDVFNMARDNLERDNLTAAMHSVDVVLPYLDPRVIAFALALDASWKIRDQTNKYVLRKVAEQVMPREVAHKPKKAIQYGTGVSSTLQKIARKRMRTSSKRGLLKLYLQSIAEKQGIMVAE